MKGQKLKVNMCIWHWKNAAKAILCNRAKTTEMRFFQRSAFESAVLAFKTLLIYKFKRSLAMHKIAELQLWVCGCERAHGWKEERKKLLSWFHQNLWKQAFFYSSWYIAEDDDYKHLWESIIKYARHYDFFIYSLADKMIYFLNFWLLVCHVSYERIKAKSTRYI